MFDKQLHRCIFDRKFSSLTKLPDTRPKNTCDILRDYLNRFSQLNHEGLNCGPVLNWLQLDNRGRRILVPESDSCPINTPAVAAAYAVRPYAAQAADEISFQVKSSLKHSNSLKVLGTSSFHGCSLEFVMFEAFV